MLLCPVLRSSIQCCHNDKSESYAGFTLICGTSLEAVVVFSIALEELLKTSECRRLVRWLGGRS